MSPNSGWPSQKWSPRGSHSDLRDERIGLHRGEDVPGDVVLPLRCSSTSVVWSFSSSHSCLKYSWRKLRSLIGAALDGELEAVGQLLAVLQEEAIAVIDLGLQVGAVDAQVVVAVVVDAPVIDQSGRLAGNAEEVLRRDTGSVLP